MRKFSLTSDKYSGAVTLWYNEEGILVYYHNDTEMTAKGHRWMLDNLPKDMEALEFYKKNTKGTLVEIPPEISFDVFWDAYAKKTNRKRCEALWKKMSEAKQLQAIVTVKNYDRYLNRVKWRGKADPDTYLRNEYYETEWNQVLQ